MYFYLNNDLISKIELIVKNGNNYRIVVVEVVVDIVRVVIY